jgi:hypothetical protein
MASGKDKTEEAQGGLTKADPVLEAINRGIDAWVNANLRNTAFSQDTAAWNHLQGALPLLGPAIKGEIG